MVNLQYYILNRVQQLLLKKAYILNDKTSDVEIEV